MLPDYLLMRSLLFVALYFADYYSPYRDRLSKRIVRVPFSRAEYMGKAHAGEPEAVVQTILAHMLGQD